MRLSSIASALAALTLAAPAWAGVLDDIKNSANSVRDTIGEVKSTKDEGKGVVTDAKDLADETKQDVKDAGSALPKGEPAPAAAVPPAPPSAVAAPPPPPPSATEWHIDLGNGQTRRVNQSELTSLIQSGQVHATTPVYTTALGAWQPAGQVPALQALFQH